MTHQQLQSQIIPCIWSQELKNRIAEIGHAFTEEELLGIAYHFAPTFEERLRLLQLLADHAPTVANHASRCIDWQKKLLADFCRLDDHAVYELRIKDDPDAYEERYLCVSFDTALEMIDKFHMEYDCAQETEQARYVIEKRRILQVGQPFCEDSLGECDLAAGKVLISIVSPCANSEFGKCNGDCPECPNPCVSSLEVQFPAFIPHRAPVRYRLWDGSFRYGIYLNFSGLETMETCYIIPLDSQMLKDRSYDEYWGGHWHEHVLCPNVESVPVTALDAQLQDIYHAFVAWLDTKPNL